MAAGARGRGRASTRRATHSDPSQSINATPSSQPVSAQRRVVSQAQSSPLGQNRKKGEPVDRITIFMETHTKKKDGLPVDEASGIAMAKMKDYSSQVSEGVASFTEEQIFTKVMGEDRRGRKRACGAGPTPSGYYAGQSSRTVLQEKLEEANTKIEENKKELDMANKKLTNYAKKMNTMQKQLKFLMSLAPQQQQHNLENDSDDDVVDDDDAFDDDGIEGDDA